MGPSVHRAPSGTRVQRPRAKNEMVSAQMSRMPRQSTKPELALRRALHAEGLRFRLHRRDLPGTPDIVFPRQRVAVFVDGCFWHGCPRHGVTPKNNREWWTEKLARNAERDSRKDAELISMGWLPLHLWEHTPVAEMVDIVAAALHRNPSPSAVPSQGEIILGRPEVMGGGHRRAGTVP